jgi:tRNA A-37 threonylcarbamoyl transferase component Bud32
VIDFAGYHIERLVATGAQGAIYEARHKDLPTRRVALKVLKADSPDPRHLERFIREMEALGKIDHPNVVRVHAAGTGDDGRLFLAMELVDGPNLEQALGNGADPLRAARWLVEIARGVGALHEKGIVHRDLKPSNVLIDLDGRARLCDLGIARVLDRKTALTEAGEVVGTLEYMAPEQASGKTPGPATDVFGLGAILYRILAGRPPYVATSELDAFRQAIEARPGRPSAHGGSARLPLLEAVCLKAMSPSPEGRYGDAASFARDLEAALDARAGVAVRERRVRRAARVGAALLGALALGGAALLYARSAPRATEAGPSIDPALPRWRAALERATTRSRDARVQGDARRQRGEPPVPDAARAELAEALEAVAALSSGTNPAATPGLDRALRAGHLEAALAALAADEADLARANVHAALAPGETDVDSLLVAAEVERALEEPALALATLERGHDPRITLSTLALRLESAAPRDLARVTSAITAALAAASEEERPALVLLSGEAALARGDGDGALAWANRALAASRPAGAESPAELALSAEARLALGDMAGALEDAGRACQRVGSVEHVPVGWVSELAPILGAGAQAERAHRARARVLVARGERRAATRELGLAAAAARGRRAARLELTRAELAASSLLADAPDVGADVAAVATDVATDVAAVASALAAVERGGLREPAALVRARLAFSLGDAEAAERALEGFAPLARARLLLMLAGPPGENPRRSAIVDAARTLAAQDDGLSGWALEAAGDPVAAAACAGRAIASGGSAEAWSLRARLRLARGDGVGAASDLAALAALERPAAPSDAEEGRRAALALAALAADGADEVADEIGTGDTATRPPARRLLVEAERRLRRAAFDSLADAKARRLLARVVRRDGRPREALRWAEEAARADPLDPLALLEVGLAAFELGTPERRRAREALARVLADPATKKRAALVEAGVVLSRIALEEGDAAGAVTAARAAIAADPRDRRGLEALTAAATRSPDDADRRFLAEREAERRSRLDRARAADARAASLAPPRPINEGELEALTEAVELDPTRVRLELRARALARRLDYFAAVLDEAHGVLLGSRSAINLTERARSVVDTLGAETARDRLEALVREEPGDPARLLARAAVTFASGLGSREPLHPPPANRALLWRAARDQIDAVVDAVPESPGVRGVRAFLGRALGRDEEPARDLARACLAASPQGKASLEYLYARACGVDGDRRAALRHVEAAIGDGFADTLRAELDMRPGTESWFGGDPEVTKRLEAFVGHGNK